MSGRFETLTLVVEDHVATLILDRESRGNSLNSKMNVELPLAWRTVEENPNVRVAIVTGRGERTFCAGADLNDLPTTEDPELAKTLKSISWTAAQCGVTKPIIAAVNGLAAGGGLHFPADADIVLASENARFTDPHVAVGLVSALEPIAMARRMPLGAVLKLALTGGAEKISAQEAHRLGFVDEVLPLADLMPRARALAAMIARYSPTAIARTKAAIWGAKEMPMQEALQNGWRLILAQNSHPDFAEGVASFVEKRAPVWRDREPDDL
jgi:enoyl-CoA hydratase/carnithine racemase